jgi:5-(carboxyamino)imidazole ribonucleotide synthase
MKAFYGDLRLGILGGGQLGRMLIQQAINYNVTVKVLDPDREAPCRRLCNEFVVGSLSVTMKPFITSAKRLICLPSRLKR